MNNFKFLKEQLRIQELKYKKLFDYFNNKFPSEVSYFLLKYDKEEKKELPDNSVELDSIEIEKKESIYKTL